MVSCRAAPSPVFEPKTPPADCQAVQRRHPLRGSWTSVGLDESDLPFLNSPARGLRSSRSYSVENRDGRDSPRRSVREQGRTSSQYPRTGPGFVRGEAPNGSNWVRSGKIQTGHGTHRSRCLANVCCATPAPRSTHPVPSAYGLGFVRGCDLGSSRRGGEPGRPMKIVSPGCRARPWPHARCGPDRGGV